MSSFYCKAIFVTLNSYGPASAREQDRLPQGGVLGHRKKPEKAARHEAAVPLVRCRLCWVVFYLKEHCLFGFTLFIRLNLVSRFTVWAKQIEPRFL